MWFWHFVHTKSFCERGILELIILLSAMLGLGIDGDVPQSDSYRNVVLNANFISTFNCRNVWHIS